MELSLHMMNLIRSIYEDCIVNWSEMNLSFKGNLRLLSKSLRFISPRFAAPKTCTFDHVMTEARKARVVLFGEQHEQPNILKAQLCILEGMATQAQEQKSSLVLILEMFNFQQQNLLDAYHNHEISLIELQENYKGSEGFSILNHYGYILEAARRCGVRVIAGFIPRTLSRTIINEGKGNALQQIYEMGGPSEKFYVDGSEDHYRYFQGLISGDMVAIQDRYRKIFPAQVLKDSYFAYTVNKAIKISDDVKVLGICGSGHMDYGYGIPERLSDVAKVLITSRMKEDPVEKDVAHFVYQY